MRGTLKITDKWKSLRKDMDDLICAVNVKTEKLEAEEKCMKEKQDESYIQGAEDMRKAMIPIVTPDVRLGMQNREVINIFCTPYISSILEKNSAIDIIDKVNQWKAEKDADEKDQELHVGDEVTTDNGFVGIIIDVGDDDSIVWLAYRITSAARGLDSCWTYSAKCKKTGRHFDSIPFDYNPEKEEDTDE